MIEIPAVLTTYMQGLVNRDVDKIAGTVAEDLAVIVPPRTLTKEEFLGFLRALYAGFPDWHYEHDVPEFQADVIAVKWRQGGTHTATFAVPGLAPIPATGRHVLIPEHYFFY